jgi:acyl dehydratase
MADKLSTATLDRFIGKELGVSAWARVDQKRIDEFADCTGDRQWIHVNPTRAERESPFRRTIAHGYLTLSAVGPAQMDVWITPAGIGTALHYGLDRVRFVTAVREGSNVRTRVKLTGVEPKGDGRMLVTTENVVEIEGEDKPALIATALTMVLR